MVKASVQECFIPVSVLANIEAAACVSKCMVCDGRHVWVRVCLEKLVYVVVSRPVNTDHAWEPAALSLSHTDTKSRISSQTMHVVDTTDMQFCLFAHFWNPFRETF